MGGFADTGQVSVRIRWVITMRAGGVLVSPFDFLDLGDHVGDDPDCGGHLSRAWLVAAIGLGVDRVVWMSQVHGDRVKVVHEPCDAVVDNTDALVTRTSQPALPVVTIHCVPVLLSDARPGVTAAVHVGEGRGSARCASPCDGYDAGPGCVRWRRDIAVLLGPAVSGRNYEVPVVIADGVEAASPDSCTTTRISAGTPGLDLRTGIACQFRDLGVMSIEDDPRRTVADRALFSHLQTVSTGRLASLVWVE